RIAQERDEGGEVRDGEEPVRVLAGPGAREPGLQQRAGGGDEQVRQPDRGAEEEQDAADGLVITARFPRLRRRNRQRCHRRGEKRRMDDRLEPVTPQRLLEEVSV